MLCRGGAEILLPFRKEQICFHKNEQKIRPLGIGLNIFCEGLMANYFLLIAFLQQNESPSCGMIATMKSHFEPN